MKPSGKAMTTTLTTQPRSLEDFVSYTEAAAKVAELRRQQADLGARLVEANRRMHEKCHNQAIPPPKCCDEVNEINQRLETAKAEIVAAERAVRSAAAEAALAISRAAKPMHDELRARVIRALRDLRDALRQEQIFRAEMDARGVLSASVIRSATIPALTQPGKLDAVIKSLEGGF